MTKVTNLLSQVPTSVASTNELRDIKPPVEIPSGWVWLAWALGAVALAALVYLGWRLWQKHRVRAAAPVIIPPHVRALQKLEEALALIGQPEPFVVAVSGTVRVYLEERFDFRAPERTTEEFLRELSGTPLLSVRQQVSLGDFLTTSDLVKFAKFEPAEPQLRDLHAAAIRLVQETQPVSNAAAPESPDTGSAAAPPAAGEAENDEAGQGSPVPNPVNSVQP